MILHGIDISHWQGSIDFKKVKDSGIEFAILKAGGSDKGFYKDSKFEEFYAHATAYEIPVGAYYFVGKNMVSAADGKADAERFLEICKGKEFQFPLYIDLEATAPATKVGTTDGVIAFCQTLESAGCYAGIYASDISGFKSRLDDTRLKDFDHWVARYGTAPVYVEKYGMWQTSSKGTVDGIGGNVDLDTAFYNYPAVIKRKGLNKL